MDNCCAFQNEGPYAKNMFQIMLILSGPSSCVGWCRSSLLYLYHIQYCWHNFKIMLSIDIIIMIDVIIISKTPTVSINNPMNGTRDHFVYAPSKWETTLHCNAVSRWLGAYTKWSLQYQALIIPERTVNAKYRSDTCVFTMCTSNELYKALISHDDPFHLNRNIIIVYSKQRVNYMSK